MVLGALVVARRVPAGALALGALVAVGVQGVGLGLPTVWLVGRFGAAMWFIGGVGHGTKNVLARTLIQERVPDRLHGRAFAAYNGLRNGAELVALGGGGLLVAAIGGRTTLALAGAIPVPRRWSAWPSTGAPARPRRRPARTASWSPSANGSDRRLLLDRLLAVLRDLHAQAGALLVDRHAVARVQLARQHLARKLVVHQALDRPPQRPGAELGVEALLGESGRPPRR